MEFVIGGLLVIIALFIVGFILRKRVYDNVDRLENWKMDIMNRNVTSELSKVKNLNLSGETQEKFEAWKENWDLILTRDLPDMEEFLLDAEEAADKFRFKLAKKQIQTVETTLASIEDNINQMYNELDHLLDSERYARDELEELHPKLKELKTYLLHNRTFYGKAEGTFESELLKVDKRLQESETLMEEGNYLEAQQQTEAMKDTLIDIEERMMQFPEMYKKCKQDLPEQMNELLNGMEEMKEDGYRVEQFGFEKELKQYEQLLKNSLQQLESGEIENIADTFTEMEDRLTEMYQLLEKEAKSKSIVESQMPLTRQQLTSINENLEATKQEMDELQQSYYLEETELQLFLSLEKWLEKLNKQYEQLLFEYEQGDQSHLDVKDRLDQLSEELENLESSHAEFQEQIRDIRKDEIEAKEKIKRLKHDLLQTNKKLEKSNIPGVPSAVVNALDEATDKCEHVLALFQQQPLDMGKVQHALTDAEKSVTNFVEQTNLLLEQARLVERLIQYGNRYRRSYPVLSSQLSEAEQLFRNYQYEQALEVATKALENVDPRAITKIEQLEEEYQQMVH
ncbi:septation ring formation regulator EzrA [Gracilibacillus halophilus YIM-C55.5]|uniref:Septation ring formation regulator EzrA n=1 Tax=Gracilibacillus halophilus YIM-C55.5 TaxID=1308866 RepID=N4WL68_9BACI|nr:septation ring formation regulator EzrA [Gracilibacillus halophilus]ENH96927.1 septation ring formation regulator EzrA [Gracilibacillus halophilus YIM-C55.5]